MMNKWIMKNQTGKKTDEIQTLNLIHIILSLRTNHDFLQLFWYNKLIVAKFWNWVG